MIYELMTVRLECGTGVVIGHLNVRATDELTGSVSGFDRQILNPSPQVQAKLDAMAADAITYVHNKIPGVTVTMPQVSP